MSTSFPRIAALVPMRHQSERVAGMYYRPFAGRPLFHWVIEALRGCPRVDQVVIDTDSPAIRAEAAEAFPEVTVLERPEHLRAGETPMHEVLLHTTSVVEADFYLQTHSTNPLLRSATLGRAIETLLAAFPAADSLFGVTRVQSRLWDQLARPVNHNPAILLRTQDLPPIYEENSSMYIFTRETLVAEHNRIGRRPLMFEIERAEAWDIDEEIDFDIAEFLFRRAQHKP